MPENPEMQKALSQISKDTLAAAEHCSIRIRLRDHDARINIREVSMDTRYYNSCLVEHPYSHW